MVLPGNCAETPVVEIESRAVLSVPQADLWPGITSGLAVNREQSLPTSRTSRERSGYAENVVCYPFIEFSRRGPTRTFHGG